MKKLALFLCLCFAAFASATAFAQGVITGSVTGTVEDATGAAIPGAKILATNAATGFTVSGVSNSKGEYTLSAVPIGTYKVTVSAPSFDKLEESNVQVQSGTTSGLGVQQLKVGTSTESVEVSTNTALLETVQSQVTTTFDTTQVGNLPVGGGFDELALLIPGVVSTHSNNFSNTNGASISSNGNRGRDNNFELDGQSNNDNSVAGPQVFFSNNDALDQVQIITNNFSAQYGRDAGSVVNYITKSGTNHYHGTLFYGYEGSWLSSLTQGQKGPQFGFCTPGEPVINPISGLTQCTAVHKPRFDDNIMSGTFGGPIIHDKLFGFGSAYFTRNFNGATTYSSGSVGATSGYTPTPAGLTALAAAFPTNPGIQSLQKFGPYAAIYNGGAVSQIPGTMATVVVTDGTTSATVPVSLYQRTISPYSTDEELMGRLDWQATNRDRFFVRYFYQNNPSLPYNATVTGGIVNLEDKAHSIGSDWTHTFGPRVVNQLRYSFQQATLEFDGGTFNCTHSNFSGCPASLGISTSTSYKVAATAAAGNTVPATITAISSFGLSTSYPQGRIVKDTQIQDNLTLTFGKHTITTGGAFEYQNSPNIFLPNISGGYTFFGSNGLLQDAGQVGLAIGNPSIHFTEPDIAAYFQDDWKVTPELTLNLGMRWEFFSSSINLLHNISYNNQNSSTPLWSTALPQSTTVFPYVPQDYKHFEPRIGFAWNPQSMKSLVVRGGYAINISPQFYNIFLNSYGSAPVVLSNTVTGCNNTTKLCTPAGGATFASVHALDNQYLPTGGDPGTYNQTLVNPNFREPITQSYSLGVQEQLGRAAVMEIRYVGEHTSGDFQSINANPAIGYAAGAFSGYFTGVTPCATTTADGYNGGNGRINCNASNIRLRANTAFEIYNGLQVNLTSRDYHGMTGTFAYTWSRTIDNSSEVFGTGTAGNNVAFAQNALNTNTAERAVSGNSYPNVASLSLVYVEPFFKKQSTILGRLLGGYQLNTIWLYNSGQPYTPQQAVASSGVEANFCDYNFDATYIGSYSSCRPILANASAPLNSVGYNAATTNATHSALTSASSYTSINTGATNQARTSFHWLVNNYAEALALGNPFPGVGRNTLRGGTYDNVQASLFKNIAIKERFNLQLQVIGFNILNRAYYGAPDASIEDAASTYTNFTGNGGSNRNFEVGARFIF